MKTRLLGLAACIWFATPLQARLGETLAECSARYGEPLEANSTPLVWTKAGMRISAWFTQDGQCEKISYQKITEPKSFTSTEIEVLMDANRNNRTWKPSKSDAGLFRKGFLDRWWETTEGWFHCQHQQSDQILTFMTAYRRDQERKEAAQEAQKKAAEAKRKLEGL